MEHTYELKEKFEYAHKGESVEATFIEITAPNKKQLSDFIPIKQAVTAAMKEIAEGADNSEANETEQPEITGSQVLTLLYSSSVDMLKVMLHAEQLFKSGAAKVDGEENLTIPLQDKMGVSDFEGLVGDYIANFILPSLMDGQ